MNLKEKKARILFVVGSLGIGGTEKQLYLLLKYLDRDRFLPKVVCLSEEGYWIEKIQQLGIDVISLKRKKSFDFGRLLALTRITSAWKPNIVHAFQPPGNTYAGLNALLTGCRPLILSYRSFHPFNRFPDLLKGSADRLVYRRSNVVVCNSQSLRDHLVKRLGSEIRTVVIHNGIDSPNGWTSIAESRFKNSLHIPQDARIVGTVGRLVPIKNHILFLEVANEVLKTRTDTYFVLVGDGPMREQLHSHAQALGISDRIMFTGEREDARMLIHYFDVFLLTTSNGKKYGEGFPNVVMEAMAQRIPCVVSNAGGTRELIKDGDAGYLIDSASKTGYASKIMELLENPSLIEEMGYRGRDIILENYGTETMVGKFESLYDSFLNEKSDC